MPKANKLERFFSIYRACARLCGEFVKHMWADISGGIERYDMLRIHGVDMGERISTFLVGDVDEDSVLVSDQVLTMWSLIMYALGVFTGLGIWTVIAS